MTSIEAISKIGFWFKISRRRSAGQERGGEVQPAPNSDGIFDTHTQVFRGVETRTQHRDLSASDGLGQKTFLRWLLITRNVFTLQFSYFDPVSTFSFGKSFAGAFLFCRGDPSAFAFSFDPLYIHISRHSDLFFEIGRTNCCSSL
jgi:hypothetical protein